MHQIFVVCGNSARDRITVAYFTAIIFAYAPHYCSTQYLRKVVFPEKCLPFLCTLALRITEFLYQHHVHIFFRC